VKEERRDEFVSPLFDSSSVNCTSACRRAYFTLTKPNTQNMVFSGRIIFTAQRDAKHPYLSASKDKKC